MAEIESQLQALAAAIATLSNRVHGREAKPKTAEDIKAEVLTDHAERYKAQLHADKISAFVSKDTSFESRNGKDLAAIRREVLAKYDPETREPAQQVEGVFNALSERTFRDDLEAAATKMNEGDPEQDRYAEILRQERLNAVRARKNG